MQQHKLILVYGFAIFAMFFGSGNLVFPIQIGAAGGDHWFLGFAGLLLTGLLLPLMGLFVIKIYHGNYHRFFGEAGRVASIVLPLLMLSLLGSFGVVPRCITVAFGSVSYLFSSIPLLPFSFIFCLITFVFCLNDKIMLKILGKWMSPILLLTLIGLIAIAMIKAPPTTIESSSQLAFKNGFLTGYQTMDLFAAFFFSSLIFQQIQKELPLASAKDIVWFALKPCIFGATMLAIVYLGLVYLGAHYTFLIDAMKPELMLPAIAAYSMGSKATLFMAIVMFFSCLTTAVALNNLFARYVCFSLKCHPNKFPWILSATTLIAFVMSLLDFKGITLFLSPILDVTYPAVIVLTALCIIVRGRQRLKTLAFYLVTILVGSVTSMHYAS